MKHKNLIIIAGVILVVIGLIIPSISLPSIGDQNLFQIRLISSITIIGASFVYLLMFVFKKLHGLFYTSIFLFSLAASNLVTLFIFIHYIKSVLQPVTDSSGLYGEFFSSISNLLLQAVQVQWGGILIFIGAGLILLITSTERNVSLKDIRAKKVILITALIAAAIPVGELVISYLRASETAPISESSQSQTIEYHLLIYQPALLQLVPKMKL